MRFSATIVVPCWNAADCTRQCLDALARWTAGDYEVIVVDNGSRDQTASVLRSARASFPAPLRVLRNERNRGFPKAINQGAAAARGEALVWLNNDAVVTPGWLERLLRCARGARSVGAVGPYTNEAPGAQGLRPVPYRDLSGLPAFAQAWGLLHEGRSRPVERLAGFCFLVTGAAARAVGPLDERFGLGRYEDYDYCARLRRAGFEIRLAQDAFVHHHGHKTFVENRVPMAQLRGASAAYALKWGPAPSL